MGANSGLTQESIREFVTAAHGDLPKLQALLQANPELLNARDEEWNETALEAASHMGRRQIAEYLLSQGAPLTTCTAAMLGRGERVSEFLRSDPGQAQARGAHGIPVLFHAAIGGNTSIAEMLVTRGSMGLDAALQGAVGWGLFDMTKWLLEHGANPNEPNYEGKTALKVALEGGDERLADLLRGQGGEEDPGTC